MRFEKRSKTPVMHEKEIELQHIGTVKLVKHKRARRIKITVKPTGVRVTIPVSVSFKTGEEFATSKKEWIKKAKEKIPTDILLLNFDSDGRLFSTRNYLYKLEPAEIDFVNVKVLKSDNTVLFQHPQHLNINSPKVQRALKYGAEEMLRKEAKEYLPQRTHEIGAKMGLTFKRIFIKNNKSNWGSCSSLGNINLNLHLMRLPDRLIDFVIVHELLHTIIPNHGPRFKEMINRSFPDSKTLNTELKKYSPLSFNLK
jgi:predicted metal-dependent hydrolase